MYFVHLICIWLLTDVAMEHVKVSNIQVCPAYYSVGGAMLSACFLNKRSAADLIFEA
jgi:hypothetical protein